METLGITRLGWPTNLKENGAREFDHEIQKGDRGVKLGHGLAHISNGKM